MPNLTALTNRQTKVDEVSKWGGGEETSSRRGIPRKVREEMRPINVLHESSNVVIAGRHRCNNFDSNQYLIASKRSQECVLVDMADDWPDDWVAFIKASGFTLRSIFFTHLHIDNLLGALPLCQMLPQTKVAFHMGDKVWLDRHRDVCERYRRQDAADLPPAFWDPDLFMKQAQEMPGLSNRHNGFLDLGDLLLFYIHTPGHSMGHCMLHVPREKLLFTGDLLFYDAVGRVDLPYACGELLAQSLRSLEDFPDNTVLLPGHGRLSTMGRERRKNRALQRVYEWIGIGKASPSVGFNDKGYF